jgi:hypothetical protein
LKARPLDKHTLQVTHTNTKSILLPDLGSVLTRKKRLHHETTSEQAGEMDPRIFNPRDQITIQELGIMSHPCLT